MTLGKGQPLLSFFHMLAISTHDMGSLQNQSGQQNVHNAAMMYVRDVYQHCNDI